MPCLPEGIIEAYKERKLVVFIGAGISRLMGCMGWDEMADRLVRAVCSPAKATQIVESKLDSKAILL